MKKLSWNKKERMLSVSYTHLDVYKRQVYTGLVTNWRSQQWGLTLNKRFNEQIYFYLYLFEKRFNEPFICNGGVLQYMYVDFVLLSHNSGSRNNE